MSANEDQKAFTPPDMMTLLKVCLGAVIVAAVLLVFVVLPAEYGIDPTGAGGAMGLTQLSSGDDTDAPASIVAADVSFEDMEPGVELASYARLHGEGWRTDTIEITLQEGEEVEHKATLAAGETMLFTWSIPEGDIYYDFHGQPTEADEFQDSFWSRYIEGESGSQSGSFTAPYTGVHGWYWLNYNEGPVTVVLTIEGYYTDHAELYRAQNY